MSPRPVGPLALGCALAACFADNYVYQGPTSGEPGSTGPGSTGALGSTGAATGGTTRIDETGSTSTSDAGTTGTTGAVASTSTSGTSGEGSTTGANGTTGPAGFCGDGQLDPPEACDDGNMVAGDGCAADCQAEPPLKLYVFASLGKRNGNIGPIENADAMCQAEAQSHGLPGTYLAWLSTANTSPKARFAATMLPYVLPGEAEPLVAFGTWQLFSANHIRGIDRGPDGVPLNPPDGCDVDGLAWTGTTNQGEPHAARCNDFLSGDLVVQGMTGKLRGNGSGWSENCQMPCSVSLRLYCLQQP